MRTFVKFLGFLTLMCFCSSTQGQSTEQDLQRVLQQLDRGESAEHMLINLSDINFATGAATLEPAAKSYLDQVAKLLRSAANMRLLIKGHADNTGSAAVNERLSTERANAVQNYLMMQNISAARLSAQGFGSSKPITENTTAEGRGKNRRVELEILKSETVKMVQDVIVLRNGERIGGIVRSYDQSSIRYRQFSDVTEKQIATKEVEQIIFTDGRVVRFDQPQPSATPSKSTRSNSYNPFATSAAFHPGQFIIGLGMGVDNNIGIRYRDNKIQIPPVWMLAELPLKHNVGVGISGGLMTWSPKSSEGESFRYFTVSPRVAYHFNIVKQVDFYAGLAVTGRFATLQAEREGNPLTIRNSQYDAGMLVGLRYYFNNFLGLQGEYGDDNISCARLGLSLRFGR